MERYSLAIDIRVDFQKNKNKINCSHVGLSVTLYIIILNKILTRDRKRILQQIQITH